nr:MAG TPA: HNH endonuclease bacteriophage, HNH Endonuclease, DNA.52A [Caudoviricetes sp.]
MSMNIRRYSELIRIPTFEERFEYLRLDGQVGADTFGSDRYLNQIFYKSPEWKKIRDEIIIRDQCCDLAMPGYDIHGPVLIHHLNPITKEDILSRTDLLLNPEYLVCTIQSTHNAIHYGDVNLLITNPIERKPNDTCPWKH